MFAFSNHIVSSFTQWERNTITAILFLLYLVYLRLAKAFAFFIRKYIDPLKPYEPLKMAPMMLLCIVALLQWTSVDYLPVNRFGSNFSHLPSSTSIVFHINASNSSRFAGVRNGNWLMIIIWMRVSVYRAPSNAYLYVFSLHRRTCRRFLRSI